MYLRLSNSDKHNAELSQLRQIQTDYEELLNEKAKLQVWPWGFFIIYMCTYFYKFVWAYRVGVVTLNLPFMSPSVSSKPLMCFPVCCLEGECSVCLNLRV